MEGPQTRALADHLGEFLTGKPVERILVPEHRWQANVLLLNCVGQVIQRIRSHGKWLFFDFSHGVTWLCQLVARARWNLVASAESAAAAKRRPLITLVFRSPPGKPPLVATLTGRPAFYILPTASVWSHPEMRSLGPDPIATPTFLDDFPYRLRKTPQRTVAAALLDQEVVAGLGNMLKCEILFASRLAAGARVGGLLASEIDRVAHKVVTIVVTATDFAAKNQPFPYRVFDRVGLPCAFCGTEIAVDRSGQDGHLTWYCPNCQSTGRPEEPLLFHS